MNQPWEMNDGDCSISVTYFKNKTLASTRLQDLIESCFNHAWLLSKSHPRRIEIDLIVNYIKQKSGYFLRLKEYSSVDVKNICLEMLEKVGDFDDCALLLGISENDALIE